MENDASDILGHTSLPVTHGKNSSASFSMGQSVFIGVTLLVVYMVAKRLWRRALLWQERSYKLATRRRHGIPDSDLRPFNVAYSAAIMRTREEESRGQAKSNPSLRSQGRLLDRHDTQTRIRYRTVPQQRSGGSSETTLKASTSSSGSTNPPSASNHEQTFINHYIPRQPTPHSAQASNSTAPTRPLTRQPAYRHLEDWTSDNEGKKRSLDEQEDNEHETKKSRVDGEELLDGEDEGGFYDIRHSAPKRGSKRGFGEEEDDSEEVNETKKFRGKRARKVSQEKARQSHAIDDNMDIDDEELDEITELVSRSRGKKRDRAEAGSTFGGDDDDSTAEHEPEDDLKARRRRRKRRTVAKRKSEASRARGKKRDRDTDGEKSDQESDDLQAKISRKKRGKRGSDRRDSEHALRSDVSMDESVNSNRGKARSIGEEWESNGIKYKVGLNGQRLRQALVKQARQKFIMPIDSQHPDRNANVQICIESWLTEEEYQEKKAERMLAWQDDTPSRQDDHVNGLSLDVQEPQLSQSVAGKSLLWGSSTASTPTVSPTSRSPAAETPPEFAKPRSYRDSYRHSIATTVGLPISPFRSSQIPTMKRIASTTRLSLSSGLNGPPGLSDSTNGSPRTSNKVFSKWEKQELEAQAIMKMREANRKKELEREAKLKEEREKAAERARLEKEQLEKERAEKERIEREKTEAEKKAKEAAQIPKITVTAPSSENVTASVASTSSVPNFFSMAPAGSTSAKPVESTATSQSTSIPSFFNNTSASTSAPAAKVAQAEPTKSQSPFNFSVPSGNSNTGNATASLSAPKLGTFSFPTASSIGGQKTEGSSTPLLSRINTQPTTTAPEPPKLPPTTQLFSFAKPNGPNPMTSNPQTTQTTSTQPTAPAASSSTGATSTNAPLKFTFNVPSKPTAPNPPTSASTTTFPSSSPSSLSGALGSDQQKTTTNSSSASMFNFKLPTTPASTSVNTTSSTPAATTTSTPKFTFGTSALNLSSSSGSQGQNKEPFKSSFGNTNTASAFSGPPFGGNASSQGQNKDPFKSSFGGNTSTSPFGANPSASQSQKPAFGGGGTNTITAFSNTGANPSPFGVNSSASQGQKSTFGGANTNTTTVFSNNTGTSPSPFGLPQSQSQNVFGGGVFGSSSTETPKSVFGNGTSTSSSTTSAPANTSSTTNTTTPKFSFPVNNQTNTPAATTTTPSSTPASGSGAFSFGFGQTPATTTPQSSPFGTPSLFGNTAAGTSSSNGTTTTPSFFGGGAFGTPASQQQK